MEACQDVTGLGELNVELGDISMKKILSLMLGLTFVFGTLAIAQDTSQGSTDTSKSSTKKHKKSKKSKSDKMSSDTSSAPKQ
jgi:hypothetical protein